jgi:aryl-alcohol dehydrogenase-like predicted oxidoreductase
LAAWTRSRTAAPWPAGPSTSALVGASRVAPIDDGVAALAHLEFSDTELAAIEAALGG